MVGASKILTVSYGTFSCTLEGFDEPFNTMKAIAEYFRDLAADDRYFGAEPPTPDAAMLHRIAEREIQRRVEAKVQDNGVILRAADLATPSAEPAPTAPAPQSAPSAASGLLADDSVAAKLQRIRSAVARAAVAAPVVEDAVFAEDEPAVIPLPEAATLSEVYTEEEDAFATDSAIDALRDDWEDLDATAEAQAEAADEIAAAETEAELRDVFETPVFEAPLAEADLPQELTDELPEDHPELTAEDLPEAIDSTADDDTLIAALSTAPEPQSDLVAEASTEDDADFAAVLANLNAESPEVAEVTVSIETVEVIEAEVLLEDAADAAEPLILSTPDLAADDIVNESVDPLAAEDTTADLALADEAYDEAYDDEPFEAKAQVTAKSDWDDTVAEAEVVETDDTFAEAMTAPDAPAPDDEAAWPADPEAPEAELDGEPETGTASDKLRRARARVIKVRRAETPALSPEAEAELQHELAAVEREAEATRRAEREGRTILESAAKGDEDVTRLLRQTNTEMEGPENRRRMSTLAHLKAAVAATVAELRAPSNAAGTGEPSRLDRYRADLARVVRPRRPGEPSQSTDRPAPLVLVSEQRIDRPANTGAGPSRVMPRRISSGNLAVDHDAEDGASEPEAEADAENIFASSKSFAEFAERLGATDLPDLLEAAAAYTACIEGRPHFSRPHLMRHVASVSGEADLAKEDSMRSFGQLLRQGKIEKVKRGQFAITDSSYYLAEARRMTR